MDEEEEGCPEPEFGWLLGCSPSRARSRLVRRRALALWWLWEWWWLRCLWWAGSPEREAEPLRWARSSRRSAWWWWEWYALEEEEFVSCG